MKQIKAIFPIILLLLAGLTGCSTDEFKEKIPTGSVTSLQILVNDFKGKVGTRTSESGYQTSFTGNEQIGVFALQTSTNTIVNNNIPYKYVAESGSWQPANTGADNKVYVYDSGVSYYAYYPYSSTMDDKKSLAEIAAAFTPAKDQSTHSGYTSADLMTGAGILSGNTLAIELNHVMALIEVTIAETTNHTPYDGEASFYGTIPWKTPTGIYRYLVVPGVEATVAFEHGPIHNRYSFYEIVAAANVTAGQYISVTAPFDNTCVMLNTGDYTGNMGVLSKIAINGTEYTVTLNADGNKYVVDGLKDFTDPITSLDIYITDNLAKTDSKEQLLLSANPAKVTMETTNKTITVPLSPGGMEGTGTEADPYLVTTPPQLRGVNVEGTENDDPETEYYEQTGDLDLTMYADWKPVKSGKLYDGKGFIVTNLNSTRGGIFSNNGGTIQNVHLKVGNIVVNGHAGGIVNYSRLNGSKVISCSNAATVTGGSGNEISAGGIVGNIYWNGNIFIIDCKNTGSIAGNLAGGILGDVVEGSNRIYCCYNEGTITGGSAGGGIAGRSWCTMQYCYNTGTISGNRPGAITGETTSSVRASQCWATSTPFTGGGNINCQQFNNANNQWPTYTTDASDMYSWGSSHWKSYNQGEYPKLLWEP